MRSKPASVAVRIAAAPLLLAPMVAGIPPMAPAAAAAAGTVPAGSATSAVSSSLRGVAVASAGRVWAAGFTDTSTGDISPLLMRWDGAAWQRMSELSPADGGYLLGVAATSARNAWAVGSYGVATMGSGRTLIEHWDGTAWQQVPSPNPGDHAALDGVAATSARNAWAVGSSLGPAQIDTLTEHWDGTAWQQVPSPTPAGGGYLDGVAATSARNAWAVGLSEAGGGIPLAEHWDGTAWQQVPSPNPGDGGVLNGVTATSARNAWAVGAYTASGTGISTTLIEHWDGTAWRQVPSPSPAVGGYLSSVTATSARNAWAVGITGCCGTGTTLIERWNGLAWNRVRSPDAPASSDNLYGVAGPRAKSAWAVGDTGTGNALIEHWNGTQWN